MPPGVTPDGPAMCGNEVLAQGQANACACALIGIYASMLFPRKNFFEDALPERCWEPWPGIRHGKMQERPVTRSGILQGYCRAHHPAGSESFSA